MDYCIEEDKILPHHKQLDLCTTRLPYRQGRKLTAVKVYTINNESNHLLVFGVPSLNLRQETKSLFLKFGKLLQFNLTAHKSEDFMETYHAVYERIQSARIAKRMLDTKNFYGGSLHVCYAPEFESETDTRQKLDRRKRDVLFRLRNLQRESKIKPKIEKSIEETECANSKVIKLNMGEENVISLSDNSIKKHKKRKTNANSEEVEIKKIKHCFVEDRNASEAAKQSNSAARNIKNSEIFSRNVELVDCTSTGTSTVTNIFKS